MSITEGETTQPEHPIAFTSGAVRPKAVAVLSIIHNGFVVAQNTGQEGNAWLSQVPQIGDQVTLQSTAGATVASVIYDGLPSIDPTVCAGSTNFSGQRSGALEVEGEHYTLVPHSNYTARHSNGQAQVTGLSGPFFAGNFLTPLVIGQTVRATESVRTTLVGGAVSSYSSETDRPVGACPVPPPTPPPPPPPIPALQGTILRLTRTTISRLLRSGWHTQVTINQPGRVIEDLYLQGGSLPAFASRKAKRHAKKPAALLLARGSTLTKSAGKVDVLIKVTIQGRRRLKHATRVRALLITTLVSTSGAKLDLERRIVSLHR